MAHFPHRGALRFAGGDDGVRDEAALERALEHVLHRRIEHGRVAGVGQLDQHVPAVASPSGQRRPGTCSSTIAIWSSFIISNADRRAPQRC